MKLSRLFLITAVPLLAVGPVLAYTMPEKAPYDGLITIDPGGLPLVPETLHLNVGPGYWRATKEFDDAGDADDLKSEPNALMVPLDIGYAFNEHYMADLTLQILRPSYTMTTVDPQTQVETKKTVNAIGPGDLWVKGRGLWETATDFYVGPRLAVKIPVGKVDYKDDKPELGDDQVDVDLALVAGKFGESTMFVMSGQAGFRYRMKKTVSTYEMVEETDPPKYAWLDHDVTPGGMIYFHAEPGIAPGRDRAFQIYVPIGYEMSMKDAVDVPADWPATVEKPKEFDHSSLYLGLYPKYQLDERNAIGLKFLYPVFGESSPQGIYFTLTYGAFIKM
jgi:hypothetical protein